MVFHDDIAVQHESGLALQITPGIQHDIHRVGPGEQGKPVVDRRRHEMRALLGDDVVTATGHGSMRMGLCVYSRSQVPLGNAVLQSLLAEV